MGRPKGSRNKPKAPVAEDGVPVVHDGVPLVHDGVPLVHDNGGVAVAELPEGKMQIPEAFDGEDLPPMDETRSEEDQKIDSIFDTPEATAKLPSTKKEEEPVEGEVTDDAIAEETDSGEEDTADGEDAVSEETEETEAFNDALLERAKEWGIDKDELLKLGDADVADMFLTRLDKQAGVKSLASKRASVPEKTEPTIKTTQPEVEVDTKFNFDLPEDEVDTPIVEFGKNVKKMHDAHSQQMKQMNETVESLRGQLQRQQEAASLVEFDGLVVSLGNKDRLGAGPTKSLDPESDAFKDRIKIMSDMIDIAEGRRSRDVVPLSHSALYLRVEKSVLGENAKAEARKEITAELKDRKRQMVHRPHDTKRTRSVSNDEKVRRIVRDKLKEFGAKDDAEDFDPAKMGF